MFFLEERTLGRHLGLAGYEPVTEQQRFTYRHDPNHTTHVAVGPDGVSLEDVECSRVSGVRHWTWAELAELLARKPI